MGSRRATTTQRGLGRPWQKLTQEAYARYGRACYLRLPGCTGYADTVDHLKSRMLHGASLPGLDDVRPACRHCNTVRGNRERARLRRHARLRPVRRRPLL